MAPGRLFSTSTSALAQSERKRARSAAFFKSRTTLRLFRLSTAKLSPLGHWLKIANRALEPPFPRESADAPQYLRGERLVRRRTLAEIGRASCRERSCTAGHSPN